METKKKAGALVMLSAVLWGFAGIFATEAGKLGLGSLEVGLVRTVFSTAVLFLLFLLTGRQHLKLRKWSDLKLFLPMAILGYSVQNVLYMASIAELGVSAAGAFFYTYPAFVLIQSRIAFRQKITKKKLVVLLMTLLGCAGVSGIFSGGLAQISTLGVVYGLVAAFFFGLYGVLGKKALAVYSSETVTFYTFLISSVAMLFIAHPVDTAIKLARPEVLWLLFWVILSAVAPYLIYLRGLSQIDPPTAAILSTLEPIVAALVGVLVYREAMDPFKSLGIVLIVGAVLLLNEKGRKEREKERG